MISGRPDQKLINSFNIKNKIWRRFFTEAYLEPSRTSTMDLFGGNTCLLVVNYFRKKTPF